MNADLGPDPAPGLVSLASDFMRSRILLSAFELGIFDQVRAAGRTSSEVAEALETDERATTILLDALTAMHVLSRHEGRYRLKDEVAPQLDPEDPHSVAHTIRHMCRLWDRWSGLTQVVRNGHQGSGGWSEDARRDLARAMRSQAAESADHLASLLDGSDINTMLDLGGGPGTHSIAMARRYPGLHVTLCDRDEQALQLARSDIEAAGLQDRIQVRHVDFLHDDIGSGYDLALLSLVLCTCSTQEAQLLLRKLRRSLNPGGRVVIREHMLDDTGASPLSAALFSVCMLAATSGGEARSRSELKSWLLDLGFETVHWLPMDPMQLLIGTSPW